MAESISSNPKTMLLMQYIYELSAFCTSTIAYDSNGIIHHGRNLDFIFSNITRNVTYEAHFKKDKKLLYKAVMLAGTNGVTTGQRETFTISINERKPSIRTDFKILAVNMANMLLGNNRPFMVIRETLENCTNYESAYNKLATTPQIAPSYYALSGNETYQGTIISRDRFGVAHVEHLSRENWYIT